MARTNPMPAVSTPGTSSAADHDAAYEEWFRAEVDQAVAEADRPDAEWASQEEVEAISLQKRAEWLRRSRSGEKASA